MSLRDGGEYQCFIHEFKTNSTEEWDAHCVEEKHTMSGTTRCGGCGVGNVAFSKHPYIPIAELQKVDGRRPIAFCDECSKERKQ